MLIWGYITYKIYMGIKGEDIPIPVVAVGTKSRENKEVALEQYELTLNYKDPFLGKVVVAEQQRNTTVPIQKPRSQMVNRALAKPEIVKDVINWEFIKFQGVMRNSASTKVVSMVLINNMQHLLSEGEMAEGVKVLKVYKDSIKVTYKKTTKTITR